MNNKPREVLDDDEVFQALQDAEAFGKAYGNGGRWNGPVYEYSFDVTATFYWGDALFETGEYIVTTQRGTVVTWSGPGEEG